MLSCRGVSDDHDGARRMVDAVLAGRAEQCLNEAAMASAPYHEQVSVSRLIQQHARRVSLQHPIPDLRRVRTRGDL